MMPRPFGRRRDHLLGTGTVGDHRRASNLANKIAREPKVVIRPSLAKVT